ncbi:MFS transporter [Actinopolymorpha alba]|uniref:MFS transporter n=1 Tax=Actinopolymorpha alba TaxID=533267 RepID=UPI0003613C66|nr:MFS transporter [Actinopolymorpha alba]
MRRARNPSRSRTPLTPAFWTIWVASAISFLGDGLVIGALPLLAASLSRDPRIVSLTEAAAQLGWLLLGLISGVLVDRWSRTTVMWRTDVLRTVLAGVFAALVFLGLVSVPLVLVVGFALGLAAPFFDNASSAVLPQLVPAASLERANAFNQTAIMLGANLLGPPVGAALFVLMPGLPLALNAATFGVAAVLVWRVRRAVPAPEVRADRHLWRELREGLAFLWKHRLLRTLCLLLGVINGVSSGIVAVLVLYVLELLGFPEAVYGWLIAAFAVGGLLGAALAPGVSRAVGGRVTMLASSVAFGLAFVGLGAFPSTVPVVLCVVVAGIASVLWNIVTASVRQRVVPADLLGRVTSVYRVVGFVAMPGGAVAAGLLAHQAGLRAPYLVGGVLTLVATLLAIPALRAGEAEAFRASAG